MFKWFRISSHFAVCLLQINEYDDDDDFVWTVRLLFFIYLLL